jgi:hypothetical protein
MIGAKPMKVDFLQNNLAINKNKNKTPMPRLIKV